MHGSIRQFPEDEIPIARMRSYAYDASGKVRHCDADFPSQCFQYQSAEIQVKMLIKNIFIVGTCRGMSAQQTLFVKVGEIGHAMACPYSRGVIGPFLHNIRLFVDVL